ncbi:MAG: hypothetical protein ABS948_15770 [Solibacillus sp.]
MGELIFTFAYGGSLIVLGFVTRFFIARMEKVPAKNIEVKSLQLDKVKEVL